MKLDNNLLVITAVVFKVKSLAEKWEAAVAAVATTVEVVETVAHPLTMVLVVEVPVITILDLTGQELQQAPLEALTPLVERVIVIILAVVLEVQVLVVAVMQEDMIHQKEIMVVVHPTRVTDMEEVAAVVPVPLVETRDLMVFLVVVDMVFAFLQHSEIQTTL